MSIFLKDLIGNEFAKKCLVHLSQREKIGNSFLFSGIGGIGKTLFARQFGRALIGGEGEDHPDLTVLSPEGKRGVHSIDSMRHFSDEVYLSPYSAKKRVFVIEHADKMLAVSANALLKTFEEPALHSVIVLVSDRPGHLLPTLLSRCFHLRFSPILEDELALFLVKNRQLELERAKDVARRSRGSVGEALRWVDDEALSGYRARLFTLLSMRPHFDAALLVDTAQTLSSWIEEEKKQVQEELFSRIRSDLLATAREKIEKELLGVVTLEAKKHVQELLEIVYSWVRDLHLLANCGDPRFLLNPDYRELLVHALQKMPPPALDSFEKMVTGALLRMDQSAPVAHILEEFFLSLSLEK